MDNVIMSKGTFLVYGSTGCSNCDTVKKFLNDKNKPFIYKVFGKDYELNELMDLLPIPSRSIPQVFVMAEGNVIEHVGGLMETVQFIKSNDL